LNDINSCCIKILTHGVVDKQSQDKVVDSKIMTPAIERNADELKDSRAGVAALAAAVCRAGLGMVPRGSAFF
jgi:hypothetical protein